MGIGDGEDLAGHQGGDTEPDDLYSLTRVPDVYKMVRIRESMRK